MINFKFRHAKVAVLLGCIFLNHSCVNEVESDVIAGTVPIKFSTKVSNSDTRVTNSAFEKGDKVGLYAMLSSTSITEKRYIDNLKMECDGKGTFIPERTVFYPEGDATLDFFSYYPYQSTGIQEGNSTIPVSVQTNQSSTENRSLSDFLIATENEIESSENAIELSFKHKFTKIKITITPDGKENITELYKANPRIVVTGFRTKGNYDTKTDAFTDLSEEVDIIPFGEWSAVNGELTGKEIIIIPQDINTQCQSFVMEWNGKMYTCSMPEFDMKGNTQCKINIKAMQTTSQTLNGIAGKVEDWGTGDNKDTDNNAGISAIHVAALSFSQSNVYRIYHNGKVMAEICKEYLNSNQIASRAIVVYPIKDDDKSDLSKGIVLQLQDVDRMINGGTIKWNTSENSFVYTEGTSRPIDKFYLNSDGEISLEKPESLINIDVISHTIRDIREGNIHDYPIVKIGTQYWMREDLCATQYIDNSHLDRIADLGENAGYFNPDKTGTYLYNGEAVLAGKLAPEKWRIPNSNDWESLETYCGSDASLLKVEEWMPLVADDPVCAGSNLTDFSAYPVGIWGSGKLIYQKQLVGFWTLDGAGSSIPENTISFTGSSKEFVSAATLVKTKAYYKAFSIRCIKE